MNLFRWTIVWLKDLLSSMQLYWPPSVLRYSGTTITDEETEETVPVAVQAATDYSSMKVAELKAIAKSHGVKGYYKLKKAELITTLNNL